MTGVVLSKILLQTPRQVAAFSGKTRRPSSSFSPMSLTSSSSSSSSSSLKCLWSSQGADNWPSPLTLRHGVGSFTSQLTNLVEGNESPLAVDTIPGMEVEEANGGNVDLSCTMQSNCPKPYESNNKSPCHLNMPYGSAMAQHKHLASDMNGIFSYDRDWLRSCRLEAK